jgi:phosphatidylserine decarboxylase
VPEKAPLADRLRTWPQHLLPQHGLTRLANAASNSRWLARPLISAFSRLYPVRLDECNAPAAGFATFDAFFTRSLRAGVRSWPEDAAIASPCDGTLSQAGRIEHGSLLQAKGRTFSAAELLADADWAETLSGGRFATIYLAPGDYHRVHMPFEGELVGEIRVPGRLFSVSHATGRTIDRLYARNERMIALFETHFGPAAVVMVAAMLVAGIEVAWDRGGVRRPGRSRRHRRFDTPRPMALGAELGRFHWGSTVIVLTPEAAPTWNDDLLPGRRMCLGEAMTGNSIASEKS